MKFRFRADPDDLLIFGVFAGFLLFIVALVVSNLHTMSADGHLSGLNPFPAFAPDMILSTLALYLLVLLGLFASVSSMFFEREDLLDVGKDRDRLHSRCAIRTVSR